MMYKFLYQGKDERITMMNYQEAFDFMTAYFTAYSEKGQLPESVNVLDDFYEEEIFFDGSVPTPRSDWYESVLRHPAVQDKLTMDHFFFNEAEQEADCVVHTQAIERATGNVLVELGLNVYYKFKSQPDGKSKISHVHIHLEPNPMKHAALAKAYNIMPGK